MKLDPCAVVVSLTLTLTAEEGRQLYAELYRLATDEVMRPYPAGSEIQKLMEILNRAGLDT